MLKVKGFSLACAIMWAIVVIWAVVLAMMGKGLAPFNFFNQFYLGWFSPTPIGLIIAIVVSFIDALIFGAIFAWLYNKISK